LPIVVVSYGAFDDDIGRQLRSLEVDLIETPPPSFAENRSPYVGRYFLKWDAVTKMDARQVVFLDADTFAFADVEPLLRRCVNEDFFAREEISTSRSVHYPKLLGPLVQDCMIKWDIFDALAAEAGGKTLPVFNTGVMIFNNEFHRDVKNHIQLFLAWFDKFEDNPDLFPCWNKHIADEVAVSLSFGSIESFSFGLLQREDAPFYMEYLGGEVAHPGVICHIFGKYYPFFAQEFIHP
jgi:hypothetical protein